MRVFLAMLAAVGVVFVAAPQLADAQGNGAARRSLTRSLRNGIRLASRTSSGEVVDLTAGHTLFSAAATAKRLPASVEKLYTTSTALSRFGPTARLTTSILGVGSFDGGGGWHGTLYLKGGGDPTLGSRSFDHYAYGGGATMQQLVKNLIGATGMTSIHGPIVGDESYFDSLRGTPPYGYAASTDVEGELSALAYDRGLANEQGTAYQTRPALFATQIFAADLKLAGVSVPKQTRTYTAPAPAGAQSLAVVHSPTIGTLIKLTNSPSDNFFAEMLLKGIGARFGGAGSTAAGASVVRSAMASTFDIHPQLEDGSGLSRKDLTSPAQVIALLRAQASNRDFTNSLSVAGISGTMAVGLHNTSAQGRCRGKTGTLTNVANLVGYCTARDGHTLAFAFLMNSVDPTAGHSVEDRMAVALAGYNG
jgi:D-alanyl-D-alanine carboxypeptidase/D-alanyl-D-alanine-endopeptidase (penicillin-binding protein 4)